jgi:hypothetical protein
MSCRRSWVENFNMRQRSIVCAVMMH